MKMTYEEAAKILEISGSECPTCGVDRDLCAKEIICLYDKAKKVSIKALEKQIPRKPKNIKFDTWEKGINCLESWTCPSCNIEHDLLIMYCYCCGQAIDWSDKYETPAV